ncbi:dTDP-4-dehydrorhamnose reductase [Paenalcaligenes niemegkensis]|uniref:dTDP-4-dehydrorhamnose reductase n=1 Tax=Paenalcaligenes niemegkensis TaxID=2895469 RepID=UPI001EE8BB95|nr:dTDP-4-dehydrorhamnose reductase [Paenalcaligenes niemegkensis]MCQ9618243.1 dTDP-4-dehydrorhamnose reductase [Paenalcaligenes niemegkensis]
MSEKRLRALITGASGQLGHELVRTSPGGAFILAPSSAELDISDAEAVERTVQLFKPDLLINAAAYTAVDKAESEVEQAYAVNRDGVANLARSAQAARVPVFHVSTDYVFSGEADEPYTEDDATGPLGVYGASKLAGEKALLAECPNSLILRISWLFGAYGNNFVNKMLEMGPSGVELGVVNDQYGSPTSVRSVADALWGLAGRYRLHGTLDWGIYHYAGSPACTWYEFAVEIFRQAHARCLIGRIPVVNAIETTQYPTPAKRPAWSVLSGEKIQFVYGIEPVDWRDELDTVLDILQTS